MRSAFRPWPFQRALVLHDARAEQGAPDAADVLVEAEHIADALRALDLDAEIVPVDLDLGRLAARISAAGAAVAFNLVESLDGRGALIHLVPALLEALGVPFTGAPAAAQHMTSSKRLAKARLAAAGLPVPEPWRDGAPGGPWIVKSVWEHASIGLDDASVVASSHDVPLLITRRRARWGGEWIAERFVPGRELNVALIATPAGVRTLPPAEIEFDAYPPGKPRIVGYAAKWDPHSFEYRATPRRFGVEPELAARIGELALACWELFDLEGYARVDFRVPEDGRPVILEINANPCLSPDAGFAAALAEAGISFADAVAWIVEDAAARHAVVDGRATIDSVARAATTDSGAHAAASGVDRLR